MAEEENAIRDWSDWFGACRDNLSDVEGLERDVAALCRATGDPVTPWRRHSSRPWDDMPFMDRRYPAVAGAVAGVALVACMAYVMLIGTLGVDDPLGVWTGWLSAANADTLAATGHGLSMLALAGLGALHGLPVAAVAGAMPLAVALVRVMALRIGIRRREGRLAPLFSNIPPVYRNAFCVGAFVEMYESFGIGDMETALETADRHMAANPDADGWRMRLMCDLPYRGEGGRAVTLADARADEGPHSDLPGLPEDIASKVHEGSADPAGDLNRLVGMDNVKDEVRRMRSRLEFSGGERGTGGSSMLFMGPAGVGKTICARIVTGMLCEMGYIRANRLVEVDGDYLKSPYEGQTGERVSAVCDYARGGVLFIDEAYLLVQDKSGAGAEAVGVLLKAMEDMRDELVIILAGYEDPMTRLLASNEGFASRIRYKITFKPYTADELMQIIDVFMSQSPAMRAMTLSPEAREIMRAQLARELTRPGFGNARAARTALDAVYDIHAERFVRGGDAERDVIDAEDVRRWVASRQEAEADDARQLMAHMGIDPSVISVDELATRTRQGSDDPEGDLGRLIGLASVKDAFDGLAASASFWGEDRPHGAGNALFLGNPGTGKTTVAAIYTGFLYKHGYIQRNRYTDVSGDFLRGSYLGQTGKRTEATVAYSLGGVLFIDEAYLLAGPDGADQYGAEAVGVLVDALEKHRDDLVVILAGYPGQMRDLLDVNPGLASRMGTTLSFDDYSLKELAKIFQSMAAADGFAVDRGAWAVFSEKAKAAKARDGFGNARWAREFLRHAEDAHIRAYAAEGGERMTLFAEDLEGAE